MTEELGTSSPAVQGCPVISPRLSQGPNGRVLERADAETAPLECVSNTSSSAPLADSIIDYLHGAQMSPATRNALEISRPSRAGQGQAEADKFSRRN